MAGREVILADLDRAFASQRRYPNLTTILTGARGTGKTALLSMAADSAQQRGWIVARTVALPGMLDDILIAASRAASHLVDTKAPTHITGLESGQIIGLEFEHDEKPVNWRSEITSLLERLRDSDAGLLITVDEVQATLDEMIQLTAVYQLLVTEGYRVALLMAGLPHNVLALEDHKSVSFVRRAQKYELGRIEDYEVADAMRRTIEEAGRSVTDGALDAMVAAAEGYPFMVQLVGFRVWDLTSGSAQIGIDEARAGIARARLEMRDRIVAPTYETLSAGDRAFLKAMAKDKQPMRIADVAYHLGKSRSYATQYKNRLLKQGVIGERNGLLRFEIPMMREFVVENNCE